MASFGQRLRKTRTEHKLTQKQFSEIFKISESAVGMYERDEREPAFKLIHEIADYFNVSIDYLQGRSISKNSSSGSAYSDGGKDWTEEEKAVADAAVQAWREMKKKQREQEGK
ncbi:helix-turn-helix domain-containing protein [Paenibacillus polymyxa]|uniref:helix-turn-helix domain-containing protein n=1 Tax=Paenibacillus polymyxa TaxID=1406 RepID=UPI00211D58F2|nr:helix-turn-helix transcriptional regulator [Paenibacillus polymyxa]